MELLFLSHCLPYPPDKGERIRAFHELRALAGRHRVHLACFTRERPHPDAHSTLARICASVDIQPLNHNFALLRAGCRFLLGGCLTTAYYHASALHAHVRRLASQTRLDGAFVYCSAMMPFAPAGVPVWFDMVDVDSEKWLQYAATRRFGLLYGAEARRLRALEAEWSRRARATWVTTTAEAAVLRSFVPETRVLVVENGVNHAFFDPSNAPKRDSLERQRYLAFVGAMDYYPNADAVRWFADHVLPVLRRDAPELEFVIVGRDPAPAVQALRARPGITVTGTVPDVRPYLASAEAVVAPLQIARGMQNKVLEALSMGKRVLASPAVARTFGDALPTGIAVCATPEDYAANLRVPAPDPQAIRESAIRRFDWDANLAPLLRELESG